MQTANDVYMVFDTIYPVGVAILVFQNAPDEFVQYGAVFFDKGWFTVFGTENDLI